MAESPRLHDVCEFQTCEQDLAVFVGLSDLNQLHCGILFKNGPGLKEFNALHLCWHHILKNDESCELLAEGTKYYYVLPDVDKFRSTIIAAVCRKVMENYAEEGLPYGLRYENASFDPVLGTLIMGGTECGLTCATFVLAVFLSGGVSLIEIAAWEPREEDMQWHEQILFALEKYGASPDHIANVKKEVGCARFRPEEVAASATFSPQPAASLQIIARGEIIKQALEQA
jgi:hypothetical protein